MKGMGGQNMNLGHFYGKIVDIANGKPVEGATVQLIQNKFDSIQKKKRDLIISTQITGKKGEFSMENLPVIAQYKLKITSIGYKSLEQKLGFEMNMNAAKSGDYSSMLSAVDKDLGNISLERDPQQMQNITVTGTKSLLQLSGDKKIYNVEKDLTATGGTAMDVMKNVPTVNVDVDGNVSMRNASPQIFVDGRPTTLSLDQIPADQIATIEIISNPSAKYDASGGGGGILNIVLKKNRKSGYNGNYRASIDSRGKPGTGGDINLRQNKMNFTLAGMLGTRKTILSNTSRRTDFLSDGDKANLNQTNRPVGNGMFGFIRTGVDFFLDNRNTLTLNGNIGRGNFKNRDLLYLNYDTNGIFSNQSLRSTYTEAYYRNYGSTISFKHNFAKSGMEWTVDGTINYSENDNTGDFQFPGMNNGISNLLQRSQGGGFSRLYTLQTDYVNPLPGNQKLEMGLRMNMRTFSSSVDNYIDTGNGVLLFIPGFGTQYAFDDHVYAAYANYSRQFNRFSYQTGLRLESSDYTGTLTRTGEKFVTSYPISLFPSANMTYKINPKQDLAVNYSRKINRPNFFQLMPVADSSDILNISVGNPGLQPEFTNLIEISYSLQYGKGQSFLATAYGRISENLISRYQITRTDIKPSGDTVLVTTFGNAAQSLATGLELTAKNKFFKWWECNSSLNFFNTRISSDNLPGTGNREQFSWLAKMNNSIKLGNNFTLQLSGEYQGRTLLPTSGGGGRMYGGGMFFGGGGGFGQTQSTAQGYIKAFYGVDIALKKEFMKNNAASLTLQCSDVFRSRINATNATSFFFTQENERLRDPQLCRLSFNWRFGKMDVSLFKRKNMKAEMENMQNMMN
jgi:outer membrane receptor protein involved in Fe transport